MEQLALNRMLSSNPQDAGSYEEEELKRLYEPEVFPRQRNSQRAAPLHRSAKIQARQGPSTETISAQRSYLQRYLLAKGKAVFFN